MDFNFKNPSHLFALLLISASFAIIIILPIFSFFGVFPSTDSIELENLSESIRLMAEIITLVLQLALVLVLFILFPVLWYLIVNKCTFKELLLRVRLTLENIDKAFLWGLLSAIIIFVLIFAIEIVFIAIGHNSQDLSNIPDIQKLFSWPVLFFLVAFQPIGEEFFFRGFLLEKIEKFGGSWLAIIITSILFGIAHMSYGKIFPVLMPIIMGIVLGYIVIKTKNLYSSIIAHIIFNVTSLSLAYAGSELLKDVSLIL